MRLTPAAGAGQRVQQQPPPPCTATGESVRHAAGSFRGLTKRAAWRSQLLLQRLWSDTQWCAVIWLLQCVAGVVQAEARGPDTPCTLILMGSGQEADNWASKAESTPRLLITHHSLALEECGETCRLLWQVHLLQHQAHWAHALKLVHLGGGEQKVAGSRRRPKGQWHALDPGYGKVFLIVICNLDRGQLKPWP